MKASKVSRGDELLFTPSSPTIQFSVLGTSSGSGNSELPIPDRYLPGAIRLSSEDHQRLAGLLNRRGRTLESIRFGVRAPSVGNISAAVDVEKLELVLGRACYPH